MPDNCVPLRWYEPSELAVTVETVGRQEFCGPPTGVQIQLRLPAAAMTWPLGRSRKLTGAPAESGGMAMELIVLVAGSNSSTSAPEAEPHWLVIQLHLTESKMTLPF